MAKKVILYTLILSICICPVSAIGNNANSDIAYVVIDELLQFTPEERSNMLFIFGPMLVSDSGIDAIVSMVERHSPESAGILDQIIGHFLSKVDKQTAIKAISWLKNINEDARKRILVIYQNKEEQEISPAAFKALDYFMQKAYNRYDKLDQLLNEEEITAQVITAFLKNFYDVNESKPLFTEDGYSGSENFVVYYISPRYKAQAESIADIIDKINTALSSDEKTMLKQLLGELGLYTPFVSVVPGHSKTGTALVPFSSQDEMKLVYTVIDNGQILPAYELSGATVIEIALYKNGIKQEFGQMDEPCTIGIPVEDSNITAFKIEDSMIPVKHNICIGDKLYIRVNSTGYYGLRRIQKHFVDSDGWGGIYIENLYERGIINGKSEGIFAPGDNITREEFVKLIVEMFDYSDKSYYANFHDVSGDDWFYKYVAIAYKNKIIDGIGNNLFGTGRYISRQDICKIIYNCINAQIRIKEPTDNGMVFLDADEIDEYARESVAFVKNLGIVSGDDEGFFNPKSNATRQEAAKIIYGLLELYVKNTINQKG
jgi:hypothetical protein